MRLIDHNGLAAKGINYSRTQIWRLVRSKQFPRPVKLGAGRNAWVESEVDAWIQSRIKERDGEAA